MPRAKKTPPPPAIKRFLLVDQTKPKAREFIIYCQTEDQALMLALNAKLGTPPYAATEETEAEARKRMTLFEGPTVKGRVP